MNGTNEAVRKPIVEGNWHGKSALIMGGKCCLSFLAMYFILFLGVLLLAFDALWMKIALCLVLELAALFFQFRNGETLGEKDCAIGERLYAMQQKGTVLTPEETDKSFHPLKGLFSALIGVLPFFLACLLLAITAQRVTYSLCGLPSWMDSIMVQGEYSAALGYYTVTQSLNFTSVLRIIVRTLLVPFFNVFSCFGNDVLLIAERCTPLLILLAPISFAAGYANGQNCRDKINQSIRIGVAAKTKKQQREKEKRVRQPKKTEQLI